MMLTLSRTGLVRSLQQSGYGSIAWNLPEALEYQVGQAIPMVLEVTNPSTEAREYQLYLGLYDPATNELIPDTLEVIKVNESESFVIAGASFIQMEGEIVLDCSGIILAVLLYDVASDSVPGYVAVLLSPPDAGSNLSSMLGGFVAVAAIGMMIPVLSDTLKVDSTSSLQE